MSENLSPSTGFRMTLIQAVAFALAIGGAGYSVGIVYAQQASHEASEGHPALVHRVMATETTLAKVAAVLELMEKRIP